MFKGRGGRKKYVLMELEQRKTLYAGRREGGGGGAGQVYSVIKDIKFCD